jgi:hypothetical protein
MADMRSIATAWEARATDLNQYNAAGLSWPAPTVTITTGLTGLLEPTYIKKVPVYDAWNSQFLIGSSNTSYAVRSLGANKTSDIGAGAGGSIVTTGDFDCDIVFADGTFVIYPEGVQSQ